VHQQAVAGLVVAEAERRLPDRNYLALTCLPDLAPPGPLGDLGPLVGGELVQYAAVELAFRAVVGLGVERYQAGTVLGELLFEDLHVHTTGYAISE
jgi:hypothetical protein